MPDIHEKIKLANLKKERIIQAKDFSLELNSLLRELKTYIIDAERERHRTGMAKICSQCAIENKPCCGSGIELKFSPELLTINLLYGISFPNKAKIDGMCFFLTNKGCCLFARDVFCINFICDRIKTELSINKLKKLRELEGLQLNLQFKIEEILKNF
ncbi:MAG: hypothetical protein N2202_09335 [Proteobacteria bacterium]|nr:hypothetical protein [Pseudomonadota bacterium]